jgi:hypothetical protein
VRISAHRFGRAPAIETTWEVRRTIKCRGQQVAYNAHIFSHNVVITPPTSADKCHLPR